MNFWSFYVIEYNLIFFNNLNKNIKAYTSSSFVSLLLVLLLSGENCSFNKILGLWLLLLGLHLTVWDLANGLNGDSLNNFKLDFNDESSQLVWFSFFSFKSFNDVKFVLFWLL